MKKIALLSSITFLSIVSISLTLASVATGQENIAAMRFTWNFPGSGGATYLNICNKPNFNIDAQSGGCAEINVVNEVVTDNRMGTKLITDRLRVGTRYKACLVADNIRDKKGRWIACKDFTAEDELTISFYDWRLKPVRENP